MIDFTSDTWESLEALLIKDKALAVQKLIQSVDSDKQRGRIEQIDKILTLKSPRQITPTAQDTYR